jgi:hypothetical protein
MKIYFNLMQITTVQQTFPIPPSPITPPPPIPISSPTPPQPSPECQTATGPNGRCRERLGAGCHGENRTRTRLEALHHRAACTVQRAKCHFVISCNLRCMIIVDRINQATLITSSRELRAVAICTHALVCNDAPVAISCYCSLVANPGKC